MEKRDLVRISRENVSILLKREISFSLYVGIKKYLAKNPKVKYLTLFVEKETIKENLDLWEVEHTNDRDTLELIALAYASPMLLGDFYEEVGKILENSKTYKGKFSYMQVEDLDD